MSTVTPLSSSIRETYGTIACKQIRKTEMIPAVVYGDKQENLLINLPQKEVNLLHTRHKLLGHLFEVTINKKKQVVLTKSIQTHFLKGNIIHVDFQRIDKNHKITTQIPVVFTNVDQSPATKQKGQITYAITELQISCLPKDLPDHITVDLSELAIDQIIHRGDLKLPKGVEFAELTDDQHNPAVVTAHMPKGTSEPVEATTTEQTDEETSAQE
tara:strand:+ start:1535 stop:2176 length:642 start_codon:yes stop_codon:yes gene_type:complete